MAFMENSRITVQNVKYSATASEETMCFTAIVLFDGVPVFMAENKGDGGADCYYPLRGQNQADVAAAKHNIQAWVDTLPPEPSIFGRALRQTIEGVVADAVNVYQTLKEAKRTFRTKILFTKPGETVIYGIKKPNKGNLTPGQLHSLYSQFREMYPGSVMLNELSDDQILNAYRNMASQQFMSSKQSAPEPDQGP